MLRLYPTVTTEQVDEMRLAQRAAELRGEDPWGQLAEQISPPNLRRVANAASFEQLHPAVAAIFAIATWQTVVIMVGLLDLGGVPLDAGGHLARFDTAMIRQLQADPMWPLAHGIRLNTKLRLRVRQIVLVTLFWLMTDQLEVWEAYAERLRRLVHPPELPG